MSEDYVNQLTLNFLISKTQLAKLNKKITQDSQNILNEDKERFRKDIVQLFNKLLENDVPSDLLQDVRDSFDHFIDKSIYYLKVREDNNKHHQAVKEEDDVEDDETSFKEDVEEDDETSFKEDVEEEDDETSFKEDEETSFKEDEEEDDEDDEETSFKEDEEEDEDNVVKVHKKVTKATMVSNGVDDIQKLPLDWFNNIRQNYKKTQILSRKKELIIPNNKLAEQKRKI